MNLNASMQSVKDLVRFPTQDPKWINKLLIGSLLCLASMVIPLLPIIPLMGYLARMIRSGARNEDAARLPEWDDWGDLFVDGLRQTGVTLILSLPGILVLTMGWGLYMGVVMAIPGMEYSGGGAAVMASIFGALFILFSSMAVGMLLIVLGGLLLPPAMAHVAVKRSFGAFFSVGAWWRVLRENFSGFLVAWAVFGLAYTALTLLVQFLFMTVVLCMLVPFVIMPLGVYTSWLLYRLVGQAYGQSQAEELPVERVPAAVGL